MVSPSHALLAQLTIAAEPGAWAAAGFAVSGTTCDVGGIRLVLAGAGAGVGIVGWGLTALRSTDLDGLPTLALDAPAAPAGGAHENGASAVDHVVVSTADLDRTVTAFEAAGLELRRRREAEDPGPPVRMAFFRAGPTIVEVVGRTDVPPDAPTSLWGLTLSVADLDAAAALLGDRLGTIKPAVQPGRRIATLRREAGLGAPVALMTPR